MKTRNVVKINLFVLLFFYTGCTEKPKVEIYENEVVSCCGVQKPSQNLTWLKELIQNEPYPPFTVKLYQSISDESTNIVIQDRIFTKVFDCGGNMLLFGNYLGETNYFTAKSSTYSVSPIPCDKCGIFFKTHKYIGTIYEMKISE